MKWAFCTTKTTKSKTITSKATRFGVIFIPSWEFKCSKPSPWPRPGFQGQQLVSRLLRQGGLEGGNEYRSLLLSHQVRNPDQLHLGLDIW